MRVLYVSQYFVSADQPGGVRHWQHTRALAAAGHDVHVVTSYVQHKEREIPERYRGRRIVREQEDGLTVHRTYATPGYGSDLRSRLANYGSFATWAGIAAMRAPRPDVVVASSPSLPSAAAAAGVAASRGARLVLEVRDLWPESAEAMGLIADPRVIGAAQALADRLYRRADRIVALTEGIAEGVAARGVPDAKITLITNGVDREIADAPTRPVPLPDDRFVAMYVGAHGTYSSLETVLEAAARLAGDPRVLVVLVGGGDRKPGLVAQAEAARLTNVTFVDPVPKRDVPSWLARADACLLPYQDRALFAGALPNKTFDYMAAGRPIVAAAPPGELTRLVESEGIGVAVAPEDPAALADAVAALAGDPGRADEMGRRGSALARGRYDRANLAARFVSVVESVGP